MRGFLRLAPVEGKGEGKPPRDSPWEIRLEFVEIELQPAHHHADRERRRYAERNSSKPVRKAKRLQPEQTHHQPVARGANCGREEEDEDKDQRIVGGL